MDGRFVVHVPTRPEDRRASQETEEDIELAQPLGCDDRDDELIVEEDEMVLSKGDFDILQAFHRLVPLPALRSKIVRVLCEEDLQVSDEDEGRPVEPHEPTTELNLTDPPPMLPLAAYLPKAVGEVNTPASYAKHSPLTRRLSTKPPSTMTKSASPLAVKPHREINLATQTPRIKRTTIAAGGGGGVEDRVG